MSSGNPEPGSQPGQKGDESRTEPLQPSAAEEARPSSVGADTGSFHEEPGPGGLGPGPPAGTACLVPADLLNHPRYRILEFIGAGGMGAVYKAEHLLMGRPVALKVINPSLVNRPVMVARFQREVKAAARLTHPNIVHAYDADQAGKTHFLVMEFIEGVDLDQMAKERGRFPVVEACDYARQTALGLQYAWHCCGMVHRDVKPHNLMLTPQGRIKILDFGLARLVSEAVPGTPEAPAAALDTEEDWLTSEVPDGATQLVPRHFIKGTAYAYTGAGTADYMAPEEATGTRGTDIRTDIYSLGCTLYRFLAGRVPFPDGSLLDKVKRHLKYVPEPLSALRPELPARLVQLVARMMAKDPAQRYETPAEVARALIPFATPTPHPILVVDDDPITREAMTLTLEAEGYPVVCAANGREALDRLRQAPPMSLILLDLAMPVMDGWEFLRLQKQDPALAPIPVVIISAANQNQAQAIARGAADCLQKPVEWDELTAKVQGYADTR